MADATFEYTNPAASLLGSGSDGPGENTASPFADAKLTATDKATVCSDCFYTLRWCAVALLVYARSLWLALEHWNVQISLEAAD